MQTEFDDIEKNKENDSIAESETATTENDQEKVDAGEQEKSEDLESKMSVERETIGSDKIVEFANGGESDENFDNDADFSCGRKNNENLDNDAEFSDSGKNDVNLGNNDNDSSNDATVIKDEQINSCGDVIGHVYKSEQSDHYDDDFGKILDQFFF